MTSTTTGLDARLQLLIDKDEIREVLARYCRGVDRCDPTLLGTAYHPDAFDDHQSKTFTGEVVGVELVRWMEETMVMTSHHLTTQTIHVDGDAAGAESYYLGIHQPSFEGGEGRMISAGRYIDRLERRNGEWRILHRLVAVDMCRLFPLDEIDFGPWFARRDGDDPSYAVLGG